MSSSISDPTTFKAFVEHCVDLGLTEEQTKEAAWLQGRNETLQDPEVSRGFAGVLADYHGPLTKAALARYMNPNVIACALECRVRLGEDASAVAFRKEAGFLDKADPKQYVHPGLLDQFNRLTTPQKALVTALLGGGAGGAYRYFNPDDDDLRAGRGEMSRTVRGVGQGAVAGLGGLAGMELGQRLGPPLGIGKGLSAVGGNIAGTMAGLKLVS